MIYNCVRILKVSDLEIVYMMLLEDNIAEVAAWANKQGACVILDDDVD